MVHTKLPNITFVATQSAHDIKECCNVTLDARPKRVSVACDILEYKKSTLQRRQ